MKRLTLCLLLLVTILPVVKSRHIVTCDSIYTMPQTMASYSAGTKGLMNYIVSDIAPVLKQCMANDGEITGSMFVELTIDDTGKITAVDFKRLNTTESCKAALRARIITMTGWVPAQHNGVNVCAQYTWPVSCIKWQ